METRSRNSFKRKKKTTRGGGRAGKEGEGLDPSIIILFIHVVNVFVCDAVIVVVVVISVVCVVFYVVGIDLVVISTFRIVDDASSSSPSSASSSASSSVVISNFAIINDVVITLGLVILNVVVNVVAASTAVSCSWYESRLPFICTWRSYHIRAVVFVIGLYIGTSPEKLKSHHEVVVVVGHVYKRRATNQQTWRQKRNVFRAKKQYRVRRL